MITRFLLSQLTALSALLLPAIAQAERFLVKNGEADAEIVIAEEPACAAEFAAEELQRYVEKTTGARLEIVTAPTAGGSFRIFIGESAHTRQAGVTTDGLKRDAFRIVSAEDWLALVGNDREFEPREPWARNHGQWAREKEAEWVKLAKKPWLNPVGRRIYRDYNRQLDLWNLDHRGSLNAVYAFLRDLGVRWYMPGELGEVLPRTKDIALPKVDRVVTPNWEIRSVSRPLISANELENALWYLRIGANEQYGILHHGLRHLTEHPDQRAAHPEYFAMMANGKRDNSGKTANPLLLFLLTIGFCRAEPPVSVASSSNDAHLYRRIRIPKPFLAREKDHTFGGDIRIGDLSGDGRCDFLVYRSNHSGPSGPAIGGFKPCFLGAFDMDGKVLWRVGGGGTHPVRPGSVAIHDLDGDGAAEVICFWHAPSGEVKSDWQALADIVVQIREGKTGKVIRQAALEEIIVRRCQPDAKPGQPKLSMGRRTANWVHQRILVANFRGTKRPRDFVVKLGDTHVAFDDQLNVLWTYTTEWVEYSKCPAYIPAVGDIDGDGRDEVNSGYFLLDHDGKPLWKRRLGDNMDSVAITAWDNGCVRAICSGFGHVMDTRGKAILSLGEAEVPHGQEVRVANLRDDLPGPEMVIRHKGHTPDAILVSSETNQIVSRFQLNASPTNVGMEPVFWNGPDKAALLYNGGWLWNLKTAKGNPLPGLPPPNGGKVHRMGFHHVIPANLCGDDREELVLWDPTATDVFIYTPKPLDKPAYRGYRAGPRQYNPRIMD